MKSLLRSLRELADELRLAVDAAGEKPPDLEKAILHLREVELRLHDCRRALETQHYGR